MSPKQPKPMMGVRLTPIIVGYRLELVDGEQNLFDQFAYRLAAILASSGESQVEAVRLLQSALKPLKLHPALTQNGTVNIYAGNRKSLREGC